MSKGQRNRDARAAAPPVELSHWLRQHAADVWSTAPVPLRGPTEVVCVDCRPSDLAAAVARNQIPGSALTIRESDGCDRCGAWTSMEDAVWVIVARDPAAMVVGLCAACGALERVAS